MFVYPLDSVILQHHLASSFYTSDLYLICFYLLTEYYQVELLEFVCSMSWYERHGYTCVLDFLDSLNLFAL
jgi:hypothetical protein